MKAEEFKQKILEIIDNHSDDTGTFLPYSKWEIVTDKILKISRKNGIDFMKWYNIDNKDNADLYYGSSYDDFIKDKNIGRWKSNQEDK